LIDRIHDADERVRAAICKVIGNVDFETALHHISEETLKAVGGRMSDKRVSSPCLKMQELICQSVVRSEAASALGKLWSLAYTLMSAYLPSFAD
jgi:sister-chromatid-cohesion protein PDS5